MASTARTPIAIPAMAMPLTPPWPPPDSFFSEFLFGLDADPGGGGGAGPDDQEFPTVLHKI